MKKKFLFIFLGLSLFTAMAVFARAETFFDTFESPFYNGIRYLKFLNIVQGYEGNFFKPDNTITRAEFTKIIIAGQFDKSEIDDCSGGKKFSDVPEGDWVIPYLCVATNHEVIEGYSDGTFKPAANINFAEAAKIINVTFGYQTEMDDIWYKPYIVNLEEAKISPNTITDVSKEITRGEMAEMIFRIKDRVSNKTTTTFFVSNDEPVMPQESKDTCTQNYFKMAFIVVTEPGVSLSDAKKESFINLGEIFEKAFFTATNNLAVMEVSEVSSFSYEDIWTTIDGNGRLSLGPREVAKKFYETHGDDYDFITIFSDYENSPGTPWHTMIRNDIKNIGDEIVNLAAEYGSKGRLKGLSGDFGSNIDDVNSEKDYVIWMLLHETGHQWCCGISDPSLKIADGAHFSLGLETVNNSVILGVGGTAYYTFNKESGKFLTMYDDYAEKFSYHPFVLYFMGVLPEDQYDVEYAVYDTEPLESELFEDEDIEEELANWWESDESEVGNATFFRNVSVNDIIETVGERTCKN